MFYCFLQVLWILLPRGSMDLTVWLFYRLNSAASALGFVFIVVALDRKWINCKFYDLCIFVVGCHFLAINSFTRSNAEHLFGVESKQPVGDEAYQLLVCMTLWAGFLAHAEIDMRYFFALIHWNMFVWLALGVIYGTALPFEFFVKLTLTYYILCLIMLEHSRRAERRRREMLFMSVELEKLAEHREEFAEYERQAAATKIIAVEQEAVQSFMSAVFDFFGHLAWRTCSGECEPKLLCFSPEDQGNAALKVLLGQDIAGRPLETLLGPEPAGASSAQVHWRQERRRLWDYASLEAHCPDDTDGSKSPSRRVARKIGLTCGDVTGAPFEVELFIRASSLGRSLFGIRLLSPGYRKSPPDSNAHDTDQQSQGSCGNGSVHPEAALVSESVGAEGEVCLWVDAAEQGLPVLVCSVPFTLISGPPSPGLLLLDMLLDGAVFEEWFQLNLNDIMNADDHDHDGDSSRTGTSVHRCSIALQPTGHVGRFFGFTAACSLHVPDSSEALPNMSGGTIPYMPIKLVFTDVRLRQIAHEPERDKLKD
ncbi:unnamed protein product [Polarella glacialis]|uniref:Uncharacterized protein n=1 Tax=Polarella glacialis TaxID=89957 RepID=A0A813F077_POLGL|nr:unnamed protein product [Polarella glacialis]